MPARRFGRPGDMRGMLGMILKRALTAVGVVLALPYACSPIYRFPEPHAFTGSQFLNPYEHLRGDWKRANLHAHGIAWGGLTNGQQTSEEVARSYRALGYDVPGVSNYHTIATQSGCDTLPIYEHGYNISKRHQLAIGARRVAWFDFPLWQGLSHEQLIIDQVGATADLVALAHPGVRDGYTEDNLRSLTGYQLLEVVNGPFDAEEPWDWALSSGHAVWALANDDSHDTTDPRRTAMAWNMIDAPSTSTHDVIAALREGRAYAVGRTDDEAPTMDAVVTDVRFAAGTLTVTHDGPPATLEFIGQNGAIRRTVKNVSSASYTFQPQDTYVRTVIRGPRTTLYLNPVLRHDGAGIRVPIAVVDPGRTWAWRAACLTVVVGTLLLVRRRTLTQAATRPGLPTTDQETA
jgi:hypothetical protein